MTQEEFNKLKDDKFKVINNCVYKRNESIDEKGWYFFSTDYLMSHCVENSDKDPILAALPVTTTTGFIKSLEIKIKEGDEIVELTEENADKLAMIESLKIDLIDYKLDKSERIRKFID